MKVAQLCPTLRPHELHSPWNSPGQNTVVGSLSLLQGIFPTQRLNPGQIVYPEKVMATRSSTLAWRIPGMAEPGGLPSMGSHRVRHD